VFRLKNMLIIPDRGIEIRVDWFVVWYQWYLSEDILELINYTWVDWWIDPKDKEYYTYYVSRDFKKYQLLWYLENEKNLDQSTFLTYKTYAENIDYTNRFPYMLWDNLWIIIDKQSNSPIQSLPNIQSDWYINFTWSLAWIYNINIENWDIFMSNDNILLWEKIKELANIKYNVLTEESTSDLCSWEISDVNWADTSVWNPKYISSYNWTRSDTPWICTWNCVLWYYWDWSSCNLINYTVTFNWNWWSGHSPTSKSVAYNTAVWTLPSNPTRTWYTFNWWFTQASWWTQITTATVITWTVTFYAQWTPINYTVTFDWNWWSWHSPTSKSVAYNTAVWILPSNPIRTWYTFNWWFTATSGWTQITTGTIITWTVTFYAQWTPIYCILDNGNSDVNSCILQ